MKSRNFIQLQFLVRFLICFSFFSLEMDVFTRFEQEAGGTLMTATLCLLEVSRHGLLETELLALLGDTNNLKPPEYIEGKENEIIAQTDNVVQSSVTVGLEKDDVEQLTDQFKKLVDEAYVVKDDEDKIGDEKNNRKRVKNRKKIVFLPAREWAIIYRNLKPLLRPCGDLGEGRLDFYHRSLSKAVRRKYVHLVLLVSLLFYKFEHVQIHVSLLFRCCFLQQS